MDTHFTSDPLNSDLLWLSGSHRGDYYFQNHDRDDGILRIRRGDQDFWMHLNSNPITENVMEFITLAGFCGETTVKLQDVNILWGLQIEGNVVSGADLTLNSSQIKALFENLMDSASNLVHINYLSHLEDLNNCGELSWGSVVLAFLYKHLCRVTDISKTEINGPMVLLQLWAWERFSRDMASRAMRYGQVEHHMGYYPTHMSQDPVDYQVPLVPQSIKRRNRRQAQAQNVEAEVQAEPVINSPHLSSMGRLSGNQPHSVSLNF
ncbi:hypothetical protein E3N88_03973 [Mikania micrantha]|uniref:Aminotransferase-like plant mobile domain-containing protein n=1 Tax=Mikania micrantha TaxID=192012 RepID=A0A5N6PT27_9ASTR|nr:hypothetical protein E3N88_03973 [Mikania micrantha]